MPNIKGGKVAGGTSSGKGGVRRVGAGGRAPSGGGRRRGTKLDKVAREGKPGRTGLPRGTQTRIAPGGRSDEND